MKWFSKKKQTRDDETYTALPSLLEETELDDLSSSGNSRPSHSDRTNGHGSYGTTSPSLSSSGLLPLSSSTHVHSRPGSSSSSSSSGSDTSLLSKKEDLAKMSRFQMAKQRVDLLTEKARESLQQILDRGDKVDDLNERARNLLKESFQFKKVTRTLKKKMWMKNIKMMLAVLAASAILLTLLLLYLIPKLSKHVAEKVHKTKEWVKRRKDDIKNRFVSNSSETNERQSNQEVAMVHNGTTMLLIVVEINSTVIPLSEGTSGTLMTTTDGALTNRTTNEPTHGTSHSSRRKSAGGRRKDAAFVEEYRSEQNVTILKPYHPASRRPDFWKVHSKNDLKHRSPEQIDLLRQEVERKLTHVRKQLDRKRGRSRNSR